MTAYGSLARGDLVLIAFPFTDLRASRVRPALVVGRVLGEDLMLAFVTSRVGTLASPSDVVLRPEDPEFAQTGLRGSSAIRLDKIATLHRSLARRRLGSVGADTRQAVARALRYVFEL